VCLNGKSRATALGLAELRICQNLARLLAERLADTLELLAQTAVLSMNSPRGSLPQWMRSEQDSGVIGLSRARAGRSSVSNCDPQMNSLCFYPCKN
jgi:hypothetical protein